MGMRACDQLLSCDGTQSYIINKAMSICGALARTQCVAKGLLCK